MKMRALFTLFFVVFMIMVSKLTWSEFDSQQLMTSDPTQMGEMGLLSGKFPLVFCLLGLAIFARPADMPLRTLGPVLCILVAFAALSMLWSFNVGATAYALVQLVVVLGYPIVAVRTLGFNRALQVVWWYGVVVIVVSMALAAIGDPHALMAGEHEGLWRGLFPHKNSFGPFLALNLAITLFARPSLGIPRPVQAGVVVLDLAGLFFAHSSTATLATAAIILSGLIFAPIPNTSLRNIWRVVVMALLIAIAVTLAYQAQWVADLLGRDLTLTGRTEMWAQVIDFTFKRPIGTGYGTGGGTQVSIELQKMYRLQKAISVQSGYLNMALELGWAAVAVFTGWLVWVFGSKLFSNRSDPVSSLLAGLISLQLMMSFTEVFGCIGPSFQLSMLVLAYVQSRSEAAPRLRGRTRAAVAFDPRTQAGFGFGAGER